MNDTKTTCSEFNANLWRTRLFERDSCIVCQSTRQGDEHYYWLANDGQGNPKPFPLLGESEKAFFLARVQWGQENPEFACPSRGSDWFFVCPRCELKSFFSFRNSTCNGCGNRFDGELNIIEPPPIRIGSPFQPPAKVDVTPPIDALLGSISEAAQALREGDRATFCSQLESVRNAKYTDVRFAYLALFGVLRPPGAIYDHVRDKFFDDDDPFANE